jgi:steroid 5-alpha reductase family enzyme
MSIEIVVLLLVYFTAWYAVATYMKNTGIIDIGWGMGFFVVALFQQIAQQNTVGYIFLIMVGFWGLRLAYHIGKRNLGKPEDFRYQNFRREWGKGFFIRAYIQLYLFQGLLMGIVSLPFLEAMKQDQVYNPWVFGFGIAVFLVGYGFEVIGDAQLKAHINDPSKKGTLIQTGLWKYTRHPNYFGDAALWWGIYIVSIAVGAPGWTIVSPLIMTYLLRFLSGVPMMEKRMEKYSEFDEYKKKTSIFIPMPQKEKQS